MNDFQCNRRPFYKKIQAYIARMPSLPTTVIKVLETCNDPNACANDLKRVISLDPVLTGRVLKLINSAYYSLGNPISSLTRAIIMLGVNTVKNLALSFTILENLKVKSSCLAFAPNEFWTHSLGVGVVAKWLSASKGTPPSASEEYFVAGLLHDLGKLPLHMQFPEEYHRVCEAAQSSQVALHLNETRFLGVDHCAVGRMIAQKWHLGESLVESLCHHHYPADSSEKNRNFVFIVSLANQLAIYLNIGNSGNHYCDHRNISFQMSKVGMDKAMLDDLQETVLDEIERAKTFLEVFRNG